VTFNGDPQNPIVLVTASWLAPDGTLVFADYTGPLQTGKVTLRSEPTRPHNEIVSLLVFGTADGPSSGGPGTDTQTKAIGAGAAYAAQPFNKAIDQATHLDIVTRVDTTSQNPKPEVEVQIAKDVSAMVAVVLGVPSPGDNPDLYWLTLAWRLRAKWTLEAKVGDRGSSIIDLFWQHRY
jgi:autotransporter translocation and assembly factor TamB